MRKLVTRTHRKLHLGLSQNSRSSQPESHVPTSIILLTILVFCVAFVLLVSAFFDTYLPTWPLNAAEHFVLLIIALILALPLAIKFGRRRKNGKN